MRSVSFVLDMGLAAVRTACRGGGCHTGDGGRQKLAPDQTAHSGKIIFSFFLEGHLQAVRKNNF